MNTINGATSNDAAEALAGDIQRALRSKGVRNAGRVREMLFQALRFVDQQVRDARGSWLPPSGARPLQRCAHPGASQAKVALCRSAPTSAPTSRCSWSTSC